MLLKICPFLNEWAGIFFPLWEFWLDGGMERKHLVHLALFAFALIVGKRRQLETSISNFCSFSLCAKPRRIHFTKEVTIRLNDLCLVMLLESIRWDKRGTQLLSLQSHSQSHYGLPLAQCTTWQTQSSLEIQARNHLCSVEIVCSLRNCGLLRLYLQTFGTRWHLFLEEWEAVGSQRKG